MIISSERLRQSMGKAARRRAEGMGWEKVAAELSRAYDALTQEKPQEDNGM
jgi:hypothetical protein